MGFSPKYSSKYGAYIAILLDRITCAIQQKEHILFMTNQDTLKPTSLSASAGITPIMVLLKVLCRKMRLFTIFILKLKINQMQK